MLYATLGDASAKTRKIVSLALALTAAAVLAGCGGGSGADVEQTPTNNPNGNGGPTYNGPAPATADVQSFKINLWDNIRSDNRCGTCHSQSGGQSPMFARDDDVNLAYAAANGVVTLTTPEDSTMVTKVGGGHNCWLASNAVCADILTTWITNWAGDLVTTSGREIQLEPPVLRDPGASKNFPDDNGVLFSTTVYPLLEQFCSHNCWTASCSNDADAMQARIQQLADAVQPTQVDPNLVTSKALTLHEGTIASGGNRYEASIIALYEFKTGQTCGDSITGACATAFDTSAVDPAMDLHLSGGVKWFGGWGLNFTGGKAQASTASSSKLRTMINATGEYSIEAWVTPGNVVQEDMRIVSYSGGLTARNFNLGQTMYNYDFFNRSSETDENGDPQLSTPAAAEVLQATLQHVVATFDPVTGRKIYVNGVLVASQDPAPGGSLVEWDDTFAFVLGNEVSGNRNWMGVIRLVAVYNRALTQSQIMQNFEAGVGEKFFLMFSVSHLTTVPQSYVVVEGSQFDSYGYLFRRPFFISLDGAAQPNAIDVRGMRIGLNGAEAHVGQSYANLDTEISSLVYTPEAGQVLAELGAVVPLEKGPDEDEFFLTFDTFGTNTFNRAPPITPDPPAAQDLDPASEIGVRTFDEISATMSVLTGVSQLDPGVVAAFDEVRQSSTATRWSTRWSPTRRWRRSASPASRSRRARRSRGPRPARPRRTCS